MSVLLPLFKIFTDRRWLRVSGLREGRRWSGGQCIICPIGVIKLTLARWFSVVCYWLARAGHKLLLIAHTHPPLLGRSWDESWPGLILSSYCRLLWYPPREEALLQAIIIWVECMAELTVSMFGGSLRSLSTDLPLTWPCWSNPLKHDLNLVNDMEGIALVITVPFWLGSNGTQ